MDKAKRKQRKTLSRFALLSRRGRGIFVLVLLTVAVCFVGLPLLYNGYLFQAPVQEEVFAAAPQPTAEIFVSPALLANPQTPAPATVAPEPSASPSLEPSESSLAVVYTTLSIEMDSPAVSTLQEHLMELGFFDHDALTTYYGTATEAAVTMFQRTQGLPETGIADHETQALLFGGSAEPYHMKLGDKGSDIRGMQRRLAELGYYEEKDNGYFGVATQKAVTAFQGRNKLGESGAVDIAMRDLLYSPKARPLVDPTPTPTPKPTKTPKPSQTPKPEKTPKESFDIPVIEPDDEEEPRKTAAPIKTARPDREEEQSYSSNVKGLIKAAQAQIGKPYVYSEEGPDSFDCSGMVYYCLRLSGVSVGRYSSQSYSQMDQWEPITRLRDCEAGDLLFYKSDKSESVSHVGIYIGGGQFIHASSSSGKVILDTTTGYYERNFIIARRVF